MLNLPGNSDEDEMIKNEVYSTDSGYESLKNMGPMHEEEEYTSPHIPSLAHKFKKSDLFIIEEEEKTKRRGHNNHNNQSLNMDGKSTTKRDLHKSNIIIEVP